MVTSIAGTQAATIAAATAKTARVVCRVGAMAMLLHIAAAYGWVHRWDHAAAVSATADESYAVTGIRAGWGIYVNWAFAVGWCVYAGMAHRTRGSLRSRCVVAFEVVGSLMMFAATIVFEDRWVRWIAAVAIVAGAVVIIAGRYRARDVVTVPGTHRTRDIA